MKSNFDFLQPYWPVLANFGSLAEQYCYTDANSSIMKVGMIGETNVQVYTRIVKAQKEKKATESVVIFQYTPDEQAADMELKITYDEHVPEGSDAFSKIYFKDY